MLPFRQTKKIIHKSKTAEIYDFENDTFKGVIKLYHSFIPKELIQLEYKNTLIINAKISFSVRTYGLLTTNNREGILLDKIQGKNAAELIYRRPFLLKKLIKKIAQTHAEIHCQKSLSLPELEKRFEYALAKTNTISILDQSQLKHYLSHLPKTQSICHGDFHFNNIIFSSSRLDNPIIIDWTDSCTGNPMYDVCRTYFLFRMPSNSKIMIYRILANKIKKWVSNYYISSYIEATGQDKNKIFEWSPIALLILSSNYLSNREMEWIQKKLKQAMNTVYHKNTITP